jgi:hypothetical protein
MFNTFCVWWQFHHSVSRSRSAATFRWFTSPQSQGVRWQQRLNLLESVTPSNRDSCPSEPHQTHPAQVPAQCVAVRRHKFYMAHAKQNAIPTNHFDDLLTIIDVLDVKVFARMFTHLSFKLLVRLFDFWDKCS